MVSLDKEEDEQIFIGGILGNTCHIWGSLLSHYPTGDLQRRLPNVCEVVSQKHDTKNVLDAQTRW